MIKVLLEILILVGGGIVGWLLAYADYAAYIYILHPEAQISQYLKWQLEKRQFKIFWETLKRRQNEFDKLTTRGILFQLAWVVLAIFALSSTTGGFGKAVVMGLGLRVLVSEWGEFRKNKESLKQQLFWQVQAVINDQELKWYLLVKTGLIAWFFWLWLV
ncbi:MAG: hypothetical protein U0946_00155 [Patescibacteria group bacterium]|nr:hypothetical protein [Patescibacteria group bacterium]